MYLSFGQKNATELPRPSSASTKEHDPLVLNRTEESTPTQINPNYDVTHPNVLSEGSREEMRQTDSAGLPHAEEKPADPQSESLLVKSGSEHDNNRGETLSTSPPANACSGKESDPICLKTSDEINSSHQMKGKSISGKLTLEGTNKTSKDHDSSNKLVRKQKWATPLITFQRRSKRNKVTASEDADTSKSEAQPAAACSVDLQNEKVSLVNNEELCHLFELISAFISFSMF